MASTPRNVAQTKLVELDPGLFLFRYVASAARTAPTVMVACEHGSERAVMLLSPPGYPTGTLVRPGDALVVQVRQNARLSVRVQPSVPNGSSEADVTIERLGQSAEKDEGITRAELSDESRSDGTKALEVLAHVARIGDVSVPAGEWIAGPENPARIEGLALKWRDPSPRLDLNYAVRVGGRSSSLMWGNGDGSFVGTRGQARPLTEVRFELTGEAADKSELVIEALFQGARPVRAEGRSIRLSGPSGQEALVGLRMDLVDTAMQGAAMASGSGDRTVKGQGERPSGRVRVFRSNHKCSVSQCSVSVRRQ